MSDNHWAPMGRLVVPLRWLGSLHVYHAIHPGILSRLLLSTQSVPYPPLPEFGLVLCLWVTRNPFMVMVTSTLSHHKGCWHRSKFLIHFFSTHQNWVEKDCWRFPSLSWRPMLPHHESCAPSFRLNYGLFAAEVPVNTCKHALPERFEAE